ncbi:hypothetical protein E3E12_07450 [Formicincola oecophyllae]|uniref:Uncharacterized protein n=1 Tax=Formicincola oecophyllae TaxID=2558361 RepID=A0A4Y6UAS0_9PROT|nr:hypothetical protein [Formicincola oecophyllae]QDH14040.1 hypothetical protein E3E12_07450 [Formicincola oecophyllae]
MKTYLTLLRWFFIVFIPFLGAGLMDCSGQQSVKHRGLSTDGYGFTDTNPVLPPPAALLAQRGQGRGQGGDIAMATGGGRFTAMPKLVQAEPAAAPVRPLAESAQSAALFAAQPNAQAVPQSFRQAAFAQSMPATPSLPAQAAARTTIQRHAAPAPKRPAQMNDGETFSLSSAD